MSVPGYRILKVESPGEGKFTEILCEELNGGIGSSHEARLFPGGAPLRIKSISVSGEDRLLSIKGISRSGLRPGGVIVRPDWPVSEHHDALLLHDGGPIPKETEAVRGGLCADFNRERLIGRGSFRSVGSYISVHFPDPYPLFPGAEISILDAALKARVLTVLWPGKPDPEQMRRLNTSARRRPEPHPPAKEILGRILHVAGFVAVPPGPDTYGWPDSTAVGNWHIINERKIQMERRILRIVSRPGGADDNLLKIDGCPAALAAALYSDMVKTGKLEKSGSWYFPPGPRPLAPFHRGWIKRVEEAGEEGVRVRSVVTEPDRLALEVLQRSGLIKGGREIWLSLRAVDLLKDRLLSGLERGDTLNMGFARDRLGGSRTGTLELLAILEDDRILDRETDGDDRRIL